MTADTQSSRIEIAPTPIENELGWPLDWFMLQLSPVRFGIGVPHGKGEPVLLIPGFLANDGYMLDMYWWLRLIGYDARLSGIHNSRCPDELTTLVTQKLEVIAAEKKSGVCLIGHSLGGRIARAAAKRSPKCVAGVFALGAPQRGISVHRLFYYAARQIRQRIEREGGRPGCYGGDCGCDFVRDARRNLPESILEVSIFTRKDGIVDWRDCLGRGSFEVKATCHIGLVFDSQTRVKIAELLLQAYTQQPVATA